MRKSASSTFQPSRPFAPFPNWPAKARCRSSRPPASWKGVQTPAVKGTMDVRTALGRLIAGTPLRIDSDDGQVITLRSTASGFVRPQASTGAGVVRGRVLNTATGEYVRNAEVRVEGTSIVSISEDGATFASPAFRPATSASW
ncbi:STN domain-containing protein [Caulobacter segnis]